MMIESTSTTSNSSLHGHLSKGDISESGMASWLRYRLDGGDDVVAWRRRTVAGQTIPWLAAELIVEAVGLRDVGLEVANVLQRWQSSRRANGVDG